MKKELRELAAKSRDTIIELAKKKVVESLKNAAQEGRFGASFVRENYSYAETTGYKCYSISNVSQKEIPELAEWLKKEYELDIVLIRDSFDGHRGAKYYINHGFTVNWEI